MQARSGAFSLILPASIVIVGTIQYAIRGDAPFPFFGFKFPLFLVNLILVMSPLALFSLFFDPRKVAIGGIAIGLGFAYINHLKVLNLDEPILIFDVYKLNTSPILIQYIGFWPKLILASLLFGSVAWLVLKRKLARSPRSSMIRSLSSTQASRRAWAWRAGVTAILCGFSTLFILEGQSHISLFQPEFFYSPLAQRKMAGDYGYFVAQLFNLKFLKVHRPEDYEKSTIHQILLGSKKLASAPASTVSTTGGMPVPKQNIVVILLESYLDLSSLGMKFNQDFTPFFHRLKRESRTQTYVSPVFGGGTANAEYEVLTGMPVGFLPIGATPYTQYVKSRIPSSVQWFRQLGYSTTAIHNNARTFWSRDQAYPNMGFTKFIDRDDLFAEFGEDSKSPDRSAFKKSVELLESSSDQPQFQFLITIGTHSPYTGSRARHEWLGGPDSELKNQVNHYAEKMHRLDEDLAWYFGRLKKLKNPPTVILFGDHQPSIASWLPLSSRIKSRNHVEAVFWNGGKSSTTSAGSLAGTATTMTSSTSATTSNSDPSLACLTPEILSAAKIPLSPFYRFVESYCSQHGSSTGEDHLTHDYATLCFDRLFGDKYSVELANSMPWTVD